MSKDFEYFPADYDDARTRFRSLSEQVLREYEAAKSFSFHVPSRRDENLFVDYLSVPALKKPETLIVVTSGVHGSEAFAGHAAQAMFINELLKTIPRERVGVLLVHCLNPFGFKYHRRNTENNVNLNRNFGITKDAFSSMNGAYDRIYDLIENFQAAENPTLNFAKAALIIGTSIFRRGFTAAELNQALSGGQYQHPAGIEFGGETWEPQTADFMTRLREEMKGYEEILLCDMHTGLGDKYQLHLIPPDAPLPDHDVLMKRYFGDVDKQTSFIYTTAEDEGFYRTLGDMNSLIPTLAPEGSRALSVTLEYGTLGNTIYNKIQVLSRVLTENYGFHKGYKNADAENIAHQLFLELFAPSDKKWRSNVVQKAREIWSGVISRL